MSETSELRDLSAGTVLFSEGDPSDAAFFVEQGLLEVFKVIDGKDVVLGTLEAGDIVGETALIDSGARTAGVRVVEDAKVMALTEESVLGRLEESDPLIQLVLCVVLERLRSAMNRIGDHVDPAGRSPTSRTAEISKSLRSNVIDRARIERDLRAGFDAGELCLHYQPIVDLKDGVPVGMEALLRWERPGHGLVTPGTFVAVAEQTDLIIAIGRWIVDESCRFLSQCAPSRGLYVSVNVATRQLQGDDMAAVIREAIARHGVEGSQIQVEITESALMTAPERAAEILRACRKLGCRVAIDDFGTGYSSLSYLLNFEVDAIKIDRSFVLGMRARESGTRLLQGIAALGKALGMKVIVEGVEDGDEAARVLALGCEYGQGYGFARPVSAEALEAWLLRRVDAEPKPG